MLFNHRTLHVGFDQPRLVGSVPAYGRGWNEINFKVPSTPKQSMILWCSGC